MIRDPSDGSVRGKPVAGIPTMEEEPSNHIVDANGMVTGLPITTDPKELDKLNRSRLWLKQYQGRGK